MPELYLIENKPLAICFQVVLEFFIFLIATVLWLTWCTQHLQTHNASESKSLAFALPSYLIGWVCLMMTRLLGSRLKEKFCFSFYLASGVRFMCSAAVLFPEFSREWYSVAYGFISLLCFVNTIFHIVTHPNPERRPVRRLIAPDGTLREDPATEMMTVKQLENYRDTIRNYMETHHEPPQIPAVRSVEVITVSLHGPTDGTSRTGSAVTSRSSDEWVHMPGTPRMTYEQPRNKVMEPSPGGASEYDSPVSSHSRFQSVELPPVSDGVIPGTNKRYSTLRVSQITIKSASPSPDRDIPDLRGSRAENRRRIGSPNRSLTADGSATTEQPTPGRIQFRGGLSIIESSPFRGMTTIPSQTVEHKTAEATPLESNQLQRCPHRSTTRREVQASLKTTPLQTLESLTRGVSQFSGDQIFETSGSKTASNPTVNHRPLNSFPTRIHRVTCPLHNRQKLRQPPDKHD